MDQTPQTDESTTPVSPVSPAAPLAGEDDLTAVDPSRTLAVLRVIWAILLVGQFLLVGIAAMVMRSANKVLLEEEQAWQLFGCNSAMLVLNILLGSYLRNQIYKRHWQANVVKPTGYFLGNVLMLAMLESVVMLAIVISMLRLNFWPWIGPGAVALLVYLVNFPHGGPMFDPAAKSSTREEAH